MGEVNGTALVRLGPQFEVDEHGLTGHGAPTLEACAEAAQKLRAIYGAVQYWIGDFTRLTEATHGEQAAQVISGDFLDEKVIGECRAVAEAVTPELRALAPSFQHAKAVSRLKNPAQQRKWLQRALDEDWIASKLQTEVTAAGVGGKTGMRFLLIVDTLTEAKQTKLAADLERDGFKVTKRTGVKHEKKGKPAITARAKRQGAKRPYTRRRHAAR